MRQEEAEWCVIATERHGSDVLPSRLIPVVVVFVITTCNDISSFSGYSIKYQASLNLQC